MTGTVVVHKTQVGQSNTAANNFTIGTLDDGNLRVSRGNAGDNSPTDVMRVKADNSVEFPGGVSSGRTNVDVTASRGFGTTYTNSTVNDIEVKAAIMQGSGGAIQVVVSGVVCAAMQLPAAGNIATTTFIVPAGSTYAINIISGAMTLQRWVELR